MLPLYNYYIENTIDKSVLHDLIAYITIDQTLTIRLNHQTTIVQTKVKQLTVPHTGEIALTSFHGKYTNPK